MALISPIQVVYPLFTLIYIYANAIHFPLPTSSKNAISSPPSSLILTILTMAAYGLSIRPVRYAGIRPEFPDAMESNFFGISGFVFLLAAVLLLSWALMYTPRGKLTAIFYASRPDVVIGTGPYAFVRHPTYLSFIFGFVGMLFATVAAVKPEAMEKAYRGEGGGDIGPRVVGLGLAVIGLVVMFLRAADMEERVILRTNNNGQGSHRVNYEIYKRHVIGKFIPGLF